ncbi:MAG TPA: NAD(P)H-hydrate dehydratase [Chryseosolibacter sp.]|nr:NAD(P)H-hydrate dehydratase [Chryseosolibacter sp.]
MLKILSARQTRELDAYTIKHEPISSIDLMERACRAFVHWFGGKFDATKKVGIVCGTGNNGGDGLGIARLLREWDYPVTVWIARGGAGESEDFKTNLRQLQGKVDITEISAGAERGLFGDCDVLVDAIFGSGLSRPTEGIYAQVIECMNAAPAVRIAVDIPSGLLADGHSNGNIFCADYTVTFELPKLAFVLPQSFPYVGEWIVVDIGLSRKFIRECSTPFALLQRKDVARLLKSRKKYDHKGTFGHALLIAGSYGKMGAAVLASKAALRTGAGLLTVHAPACGFPVLQSAVPEAMYSPDDHHHLISTIPSLQKYSAIGIGPGLGQEPPTTEALRNLLERNREAMVIDADALNILSTHREMLHNVPYLSILTPHPKEFERLAGPWNDDFERLEKLRRFSSDHNVIIVLKGANSAIAVPGGDVYFNPTGNPGMATGGTGDVLTGILTGLLAQSYAPIEAAILGVYLHGLAGDLGALEMGMSSLIASDLSEFLPSAFQKLARG